MKLWDKPRPPGYWPNTPNQWREPTVDDCTWYSTEFLWEAASEDHISMHPVNDLRNRSIDTKGGTPLSVALSETDRLWPEGQRVVYQYGAFSREFIVAALKSGAGILYGGDYEKLPVHYRRWTVNDTFDHATASLRFDVKPNGVERTFWYDPLGGGRQRLPYDGEWISLDAVLDFNWQAGPNRYYVGIVENKGPVPMKKLHLPLHQEADRAVTLRRGCAARAAARITAEPVRRFWNEEKRWPFLASFGNWKLVLWDDEEGDTWDFGYVFKDDILSYESVGVEPPEPPSEELQERLDEALIAATNTVEVLTK